MPISRAPSGGETMFTLPWSVWFRPATRPSCCSGTISEVEECYLPSAALPCENVHVTSNSLAPCSASVLRRRGSVNAHDLERLRPKNDFEPSRRAGAFERRHNRPATRCLNLPVGKRAHARVLAPE